MSGLIVTAVKRAIAFEVEQGARFGLSMDRLWMWRVCDLKLHPDWLPALNRAFSNHFLAVHRENRIGRFGQLPLLPNRGVAGLVEEDPCRKAAGVPASPVRGLPASNTVPLIPIMGILGANGQGRGRGVR